MLKKQTLDNKSFDLEIASASAVYMHINVSDI